MVDIERMFRDSAVVVERAVRRRFDRRSVPDAVIEDACAQAWAIAWRHHERIESESPVGWVIVVAVNEVYALLRKRSLDVADEPLAAEPQRELADAQVALEAVAALEALASLKPQQRLVLALRAAGFSYLEIVELTGQTYTWVNRHVSEGKKALRKAVS